MKGSVFTMFVFGVVAGTVAGLLLAPQTGRETRKNLQQGFKKIGEGLDDICQNFNPGQSEEEYADEEIIEDRPFV
ncbi:MAG TPA: YtxH domain-containing protein [Puia sp.]|nr:YtxH domain-containing protein [Puia sp.]